MKDIYKEFADQYRKDCDDRGYVDSGIIVYSETDMLRTTYHTVRVDYDGDHDCFEFENDLYEGHPCTYIRSMSDYEIMNAMGYSYYGKLL